MPPKLPDSVIVQLGSTNDTAKVTNTLLVSFLAIATYIAISVAGTTDEQLLLNSEIKFPVLNGGVSCFLFYGWAPVLLVALHVNLLLEEYFLISKIMSLLALCRRENVYLKSVGQQLTALSVAVAVGWPAHWYVRMLVKAFYYLANWLIPIGLLLAMQIKFLPFHSRNVNRWHEALIVLDLIAIFCFSVVARLGRSGSERRGEVRSPSRRMVSLLSGLAPYREIAVFSFAAVVVIWLSLFRIVAPGGCSERFDDWMTERGLQWPHQMLESIVKTHLVLAGKKLPGVVDASDRDLQCADFRNSELSGAVFKGANLIGVMFGEARLDNANFGRGLARVASRERREAGGQDQHCDADEPAASDRTDLRSASFDKASLVGADFSFSRLDGARFQHADLTKTHFNGARADWADFTDASGNDVDFTAACLRGAVLLRANLPRATLSNAHVEVANLVGAHFELADFGGTALVGSDLRRVSLQGAKGLSLQGVDLRGAYMAGVDLCPSNEIGSEVATREGGLEGSEVRSGVVPGSVTFVDIRDAEFTLALPAGNLREAVISSMAGGKAMAPCGEDDAKTFLYRKGQGVGGGRVLKGEPPNEDDFYRDLTDFLVQKPDLASFLAEAITRMAQSNPSPFDVTVACGILAELEHRRQAAATRDSREPFLALPDDLVRRLRKTAKNCPVLLARPQEPKR